MYEASTLSTLLYVLVPAGLLFGWQAYRIVKAWL